MIYGITIGSGGYKTVYQATMSKLTLCGHSTSTKEQALKRTQQRNLGQITLAFGTMGIITLAFFLLVATAVNWTAALCLPHRGGSIVSAMEVLFMGTSAHLEGRTKDKKRRRKKAKKMTRVQARPRRPKQHVRFTESAAGESSGYGSALNAVEQIEIELHSSS